MKPSSNGDEPFFFAMRKWLHSWPDRIRASVHAGAATATRLACCATSAVTRRQHSLGHIINCEDIGIKYAYGYVGPGAERAIWYWWSDGSAAVQ